MVQLQGLVRAEGQERVVRVKVLALIAITLLALVAYQGSFSAQFHLDDYHQIVNNPGVRNIAPVGRFFTDPTVGSAQAGSLSYRPLTHLSFALSYALSGYGVTGYHVFNFILHILCSLLVFLIAARVTAASGEGGPGVALAAALIFALHPVMTNAVTYISGRAVLLASVFYLAGIYSFLRFREKDRLAWAWAAASPLFYMLGLMSKEMAVSMPAVCVAYDMLFATHRQSADGGRKYTRLLYHLSYVAVLAIFLAARKLVLGYATVEGGALGTGHYMLSEARALLIYLRVMLLPVNLNTDYNLPPTFAFDIKVAAALILLALAAATLIAMRKRKPAAVFFGIWFIVALAPESMFFPITDIAEEYRLYLPAAGLITALVLVAFAALRSRRSLPRVAAALVLVMLVMLTYSRNGVWATECTFWADVAAKSPRSARAFLGLGQAYLREGDYARAVAALKKSLEVEPVNVWAAGVHNDIGLCYLNIGQYEKALGEFSLALEKNPELLDAYASMGAAYQKLGRYDEANAAYKKAGGGAR